MGTMAAADNSIAFGRPGGESCSPSASRPVDLAHLARQTMGDRQLEQDVLSLFVQQMSGMRERIAGADEAERRMLAHALKGSARSIGAFAVADCAAKIEDQPSNKALLAKLGKSIDDACDYIATIHR